MGESLIRSGNDRLDSWKEIAEYLGRDVRTVLRWEREKGLPIRRVPGGKRQAVFAYRSEVAAWLKSGAGDQAPGVREAVASRDADREPNAVTSRSAASVLESEVDAYNRESPLPAHPVLAFPVRARESDTTAAGIPDQETRDRPNAAPKRVIRGWIMAGLVVVIPLAAAGYWAARPWPAPRILNYTQLTHGASVGPGPILTDGAQLYFNGNAGTGCSVDQVPVTGGRPALLAAGFCPANISPDGSQILAVADVISETERPMVILPLPSGSPRPLGVSGEAGAWSPDGGTIAYAYRDAVYLSNRDGGHSRKLATLPGLIRDVRWAPDGSLLRVDVQETETRSTGLWEVAPDGKGLRPVIPERIDSLLGVGFGWTPDGEYFFFSASLKNRLETWTLRERKVLWWKAAAKPVRLFDVPMDFGAAVSSRDGKQLFCTGQYQARGARALRSGFPPVPAVAGRNFGGRQRTPAIDPSSARDLYAALVARRPCHRLRGPPFRRSEPLEDLPRIRDRRQS
jgi:hypothetical protein